MMSDTSDQQVIVPVRELHQFVVRVMEKVGVTTSHAEDMASLITSADLRGHYSHGLNRIGHYTADLTSGSVAVDKEPEILRQTAATALVDGNNCLGPVVGKYCMDIAIEKAKNAGIGWVCARGSNHFGTAGWYAMRAMEEGLIGMAFCNASPILIPTRGKKRTLGTNPISVAAEGKDGEKFVLDMATTSVAQGKIEIQHRLRKDLPQGWGVDRNGQPCVNTDEILDHGGLTPLGGSEQTSGYKGYGLAMMVDIFCGVLSGSHFGSDVQQWGTSEYGIVDLGQCFAAINPDMFAPGFDDRLSSLIHHCKDQEPIEGESEILVAGEPEQEHTNLCDRLGGIPYQEKQVAFADELAQQYNVAPLKRLGQE